MTQPTTVVLSVEQLRAINAFVADPPSGWPPGRVVEIIDRETGYIEVWQGSARATFDWDGQRAWVAGRDMATVPS